MEWIAVLIALLAAFCGLALSYLVQPRVRRRRPTADTVPQPELSDIKRGVEDIRAQVYAQGKKMDQMAQLMTGVENGIKQVQEQLDRQEKSEG